MKGPMTTQSLRGLLNMEPYHWRGDKPNFAAFNGAFSALMGGSQLSGADMAAFTNFINTIVYQPNPNQNLDRTMPASVPLPDAPGASGDPNVGLNLFLTVPDKTNGPTCVSCHTADPGPGTNLQVRLGSEPQPDIVQPFKVPHLRNLYQKTNIDFNNGAASVDGFGFGHNGQDNGIIAFLHKFPTFANSLTDKENIEAFQLCFDTGTAPAVGYSRTLTSATVGTAPAQSDWNTLQSQASTTPANIDLIANGTIQGQVHGLLYLPATNNYQSDTTGLGPFTQQQLTTFIQNGDTLTIMGVPPGSGTRMAIDRNLDGTLNGDARPKAAAKVRGR